MSAEYQDLGPVKPEFEDLGPAGAAPAFEDLGPAGGAVSAQAKQHLATMNASPLPSTSSSADTLGGSLGEAWKNKTTPFSQMVGGKSVSQAMEPPPGSPPVGGGYGALAGVGKSAGKLVDALQTPIGAILPAAMQIPVVGQAIAGYFGVQGAKMGASGAMNAAEGIGARDPSQIGEGLGDAAQGIGMMLPVAHAAGKAIGKFRGEPAAAPAPGGGAIDVEYQDLGPAEPPKGLSPAGQGPTTPTHEELGIQPQKAATDPLAGGKEWTPFGGPGDEFANDPYADTNIASKVEAALRAGRENRAKAATAGPEFEDLGPAQPEQATLDLGPGNLEAAFRLPDGKVITTGKWHEAAALPQKYRGDAEAVERGFVGKDGKFLNASDLQQLVGSRGARPEAGEHTLDATAAAPPDEHTAQQGKDEFGLDFGDLERQARANIPDREALLRRSEAADEETGSGVAPPVDGGGEDFTRRPELEPPTDEVQNRGEAPVRGGWEAGAAEPARAGSDLDSFDPAELEAAPRATRLDREANAFSGSLEGRPSPEELQRAQDEFYDNTMRKDLEQGGLRFKSKRQIREEKVKGLIGWRARQAVDSASHRFGAQDFEAADEGPDSLEERRGQYLGEPTMEELRAARDRKQQQIAEFSPEASEEQRRIEGLGQERKAPAGPEISGTQQDLGLSKDLGRQGDQLDLLGEKGADSLHDRRKGTEGQETLPGMSGKPLLDALDALEPVSLSGALPGERRGESGLRANGVRTVASRYAEEFRKNGHLPFVGKEVRSAHDLAVVGQLARDPRVETSRIFYIKDGRIVAHEALSSSLPSVVYPHQPSDVRQMYDVADRMQRLGADSYALMHNHPSGESSPSSEDKEYTRQFVQAIEQRFSRAGKQAATPEFMGHVIIDHNEYSVVNRNGGNYVTAKRVVSPPHKDVGENAALIDQLSGITADGKIRSPGEVARVGMELQHSKNMIPLIYADARGKIVAVQEIPTKLFIRPLYAANHIRGAARRFGGGVVYAYYPESVSPDAGGFSGPTGPGLRTDVDQFAAGRESRAVAAAANNLLEKNVLQDFVSQHPLAPAARTSAFESTSRKMIDPTSILGLNAKFPKGGDNSPFKPKYPMQPRSVRISEPGSPYGGMFGGEPKDDGEVLRNFDDALARANVANRSGQHQLGKAAPTSALAGRRTANASVEATFLVRQVAEAIDKAMGGKGKAEGEGFKKWAEVRTESALIGQVQKYHDLARKVGETPADEVPALYSEELRSPHIEAISKTKKFSRQKPVTLADELAKRFDESPRPEEQQKIATDLKRLLVSAFVQAAQKIDHLMTIPEFIERAKSDEFQTANAFYEDRLRPALEESHKRNEGFESEYQGPLGTYFPLSVTEDRPMGFGGKLPFGRPKNPMNKYRTGLSENYDTSAEGLSERTHSALRANNKAAMLKSLVDEGLARYVKTDKPTPESFPFKGKQYEASRFVGERGNDVVMPKWVHDEISPVLDNRRLAQGKTLLGKAVNLTTRASMALGAEGIPHSKNILGVLVSKVPVLGESLAAKTIGNTPVTKIFNAIAQIIKEDPYSDANSEIVRKMIENGEISRIGKGEMVGKLISNIDTRARIVAHKAFLEMEPKATPQQLYAFSTHMGEYNVQLSDVIARELKSGKVAERIGNFSPFYTAGSTMLRNSIEQWTGLVGKGGEIPGGLKGRLLGQITGGALGMLLTWTAAYKALTGKYPWEDKRMKFLQLPVPEELRHSTAGRAVFGDKPGTAYVNMGNLTPFVTRGARALGIVGASETKARGGTGGQAAERAVGDAINSQIQPFTGPPVHFATRLAAGVDPYIYGFRDGGKAGIRMKPAFTDRTEPGLPTFAKRAESAVAGSNPFAQHTLENREKGMPFTRTLVDVLAPGTVSGPTDTNKQTFFLKKELRESHMKAKR